MYIRNLNLMTDKTEIVEFMKRFSFATIITAKDSYPIATHLPFHVTVKDDNIILTSHFAKVNNHWKDIESTKNLVIFSEPHAYISPKNYDKELNVPTWNYIAVHCYGKGTIVTAGEKVKDILEKMIENYEPSYQQQWDNLPADYKLGMTSAIVAFEILVDDIQAKKNLSQNKKENEQRKIIETLSNSNDTNEKLIADYMKKNIPNTNSK